MPIHPNSQHPSDPIAGVLSRIQDLERQVRDLKAARTVVGDTTIQPYKMDATQSKLVKTNPQTITSGTWQQITFSALAKWDRNDSRALSPPPYDPANSRLISPQDGIYQIMAQITWNASATGARGTAIRQNGTEVAVQTFTPMASASTTSPIVCELEVLANDYIELWGFQSSGASQVLDVSLDYLHFLSWRHVATL